jgi:hypothetical protein
MKDHTQIMQGLKTSIEQAKEIRKKQDKLLRATLDRTIALKELIIELNREYGIH